MNWKDVVHYGTAAIAILVGGITEMGISIPGIVVSDPKMTITMGLGVLVAGLKGGWTSGGAK
jgi:hypothetical protein